MFYKNNRYTPINLITLLLVFTASMSTSAKQLEVNDPQATSINDFGVINQERIIYWLIKRGELAKEASEKEKQLALQEYIANANKSNNNYIHEIDGHRVVNFSKQKSTKPLEQKTEGVTKNSTNNSTKGIVNGTVNGKVNEAIKANTTAPTKPSAYQVNVLTLLIDFPDLPHDNNRLTSADTSMFYENYDAEHYQKLMFSESGFTGPNNEALMSAHQYYASESGGSFKFNGQVYGWLTADNNASYYGENNEFGNDKAATDLVKEALNKAVSTYNINLADYDLIDPADLDGDGVIAEPDGYIDYVMVFHSSIGADAGGGYLGGDAIWAHRWNINNYQIPDTTYNNGNYRAHGYTIQGIDSAIGVVSHEFGHLVANLLDEYDTNNSVPNSPVGFWSLMSGGSWGGDNIAGAMPTGFSPLAKKQLQSAFGGNWVKEQSLLISDLKEESISIDLVEAVEHGQGDNLVSITLPPVNHSVIKPFSGEGQYHSFLGDNLVNSLSFDLVIPDTSNPLLSMKTYWDIEEDWDYARVLINDEPLKGNYTSDDNSHYAGIHNYLSGKSSRFAHGWLDLTFDLSEYKGQTVVLKIDYITDSNTGGSGLFIDEIKLTADNVSYYEDNAEIAERVHLAGFKQIATYIEEKDSSQTYYIQLRSHKDVDKALKKQGYDHGILMWLANTDFSDNQVSLHPGQGVISVIDADQRLIEDDQYGIWWSTNQIRDAVFSLFTQQEKSADVELSAISIFDDQQLYLNERQPESGVIVPVHGLTMEVVAQAEDSSSAKIKLTAQDLPLTALFDVNNTNQTLVNFTNLSFGQSQWIAYQWDFGDGSAKSFEHSPSYRYVQSGSYTVTLEATDNTGTVSTSQQIISTQGIFFEAQINFLDVNFINDSAWGNTELSYLWNFGDGTESSEVSPLHRYENAGDYIVTLTATTTNGDVFIEQKTISVISNIPPKSGFTTTVKFLKVHGINQTLHGTGQLIYAWDFGDNSAKKAGTSPTHVYKEPGTYTITLAVKDASGQQSSTSQTVTVEKAIDQNAGGSFSIYLLLFFMLGLSRRYKNT